VRSPHRLGRIALVLVVASVALFVVTALLGPSAAQPELPGAGPARHFDVGPPVLLVTGLMWSAVLAGAAAVAVGWLALVRGWAPDPLRLRGWGFVGAGVMAAVPPLGSTDLLSYAAYGRMAVLGLNPYTTTVQDLLARGDPVGLAYQGAWDDVPSVYGPLAIASHAFSSWLAGDSVRMFALWTQVLELGVFVAVALLLDRVVSDDLAARRRVAVLWTLNPLLLYAVVNSGHLDGLAAGLGVAALLVVRRSPVAAGALVALSVCTKVSFALYVVALVWALRSDRGRLLRFLAAGAVTGAVLITPFLPELVDPLRDASQYVARQSPWRITLPLLRTVLPDEAVPRVLSVAVWVLVAAVVWRLSRVLPRRATANGSSDDALWAATLLSVAWLLSSTYAYAWYDVMAWAPLVLLPASGVDLVLLARMSTVAFAYSPGLDLDPPGPLGSVTTTLNGTLAPLVGLALLVLVLFFGDRLRLRRPAGDPHPASSR